MNLDYSSEGAALTGLAQGLGEGIRQIKVEEEREANRAYAEGVRQVEYEMDLEKMRAAHMLDLEKMMQRSMNDFTREENRRQQALDAYDNTIKYLNEHSDEFDDEQIQYVKTNSYLKLIGSGVKLPASSFYDEPEELKQPSTSEKLRAFGMLSEIEEKKPGPLESRIQKLLPFGKTGELSPLQKQQEEYLQQVVGGMLTQNNMQPTGNGIINDRVEPVDTNSFDTTVAQLKAVDPVRARAYFNQWKTKWPGEYK